MLKNKKGGIDEFIILYVFLPAALITVFIVFYYFFAISTKTSILTITSEKADDLNLNTQLLGLLKSPATINGTQFTLADLALIASDDYCTNRPETEIKKTDQIDYCVELYKTVDNALKEFNDNKAWSFQINTKENQALGSGLSPCQTAKLPWHEGKIVEVELCAKK
ncbi:MAG: hypothetical protein WC471_00595 [Candidatus Woesearchaeota archaeon]